MSKKNYKSNGQADASIPVFDREAYNLLKTLQQEVDELGEIVSCATLDGRELAARKHLTEAVTAVRNAQFELMVAVVDGDTDTASQNSSKEELL